MNIGYVSSHWKIMLLSMLCIVPISATESESSTDHWQPVYKSNSTKEWKTPTVQDAKWRDPSFVPSFNRREQVVAVYPSSPSSIPIPIGQNPPYSKISLGSGSVPSSHMLHLPPQLHYALSRQDSLAAADSSYYPLSFSGPPGPVFSSSPPYHGPSHGHAGYPPPPPPPPPHFPTSDHHVMIELAFDKLVLRCSVEDPLEHIIWTRYPCPNEYFYGHGLPVAEGSTVHNTDLYDVRIVGEGGHTGSELLMKSPLDPASSGLYVCEAWPHYQKDGEYGHGHYGPPKPVYPAFSDVFIIGGNELLEECYKHPPHYPKKQHFKKHYDEDFEEDDTPVTKIQKTGGSKKSTQNVDAIRKPRNITRFENSFSLPDEGFKTVPRYNLRFGNLTLNNASASDFFRSASAFSHLFKNDNGFAFTRNLTFQSKNDSAPKTPFSIFKSNGFNNLNFMRNTTLELFKKGDSFLNSNQFFPTNKTSVNNTTQPKFSSALFSNDQNFNFKNSDQTNVGAVKSKDSTSSSLFRNDFRFGDSQDASSSLSTNILKKKDDISSFNPSESIRNSDSLLSEANIYSAPQVDQIIEEAPVEANLTKNVSSFIRYEYPGSSKDNPWVISDDFNAIPQMSNNSLHIDSSARKSKVL